MASAATSTPTGVHAPTEELDPHGVLGHSARRESLAFARPAPGRYLAVDALVFFHDWIGAVLNFAVHRAAVRRLDATLACVVSVGRHVHVTQRITELIGAG